MAFKKLSETQIRPARRWALVGYPGDGKSSFAAQMKTPILPIDVDGRFLEVEHLANGDVLGLSDKPEENNDVQAIDTLLEKEMPDSGVRTIVVDSMTPIYQRITRRVQMAIQEGSLDGKNKSAPHQLKANAMALLSSSVSAWGTDTLWIWHLNDTNFNGQSKVAQSISETERDRLRKFLNAELHVAVDKNGRRGITIFWSRSGHGIGQTIYDTQENFDAGSFWKGMPERIEAIIFPKAGPKLTEAAADKTRTFANPAEAIQWCAAQLNATEQEATEIYNSVKAATQPKTAREMWVAFSTEVEKRAAALLSVAAKDF